MPLLCFSLQSCERQPSKNPTQAQFILPSKAKINAQISKLFLSTNKAKPGVTTLPSGLQYSIIKTGVGVKPDLSDLVSVNYKGQFIDGTIFDSAHSQGEPITFRVSSVIPGWQEALQQMQAGSIWVLFIPPNLAYGERGVPGVIGPNQTLVYTIYLRTIKKPV